MGDYATCIGHSLLAYTAAGWRLPERNWAGSARGGVPNDGDGRRSRVLQALRSGQPAACGGPRAGKEWPSMGEGHSMGRGKDVESSQPLMLGTQKLLGPQVAL